MASNSHAEVPGSDPIEISVNVKFHTGFNRIIIQGICMRVGSHTIQPRMLLIDVIYGMSHKMVTSTHNFITHDARGFDFSPKKGQKLGLTLGLREFPPPQTDGCRPSCLSS